MKETNKYATQKQLKNWSDVSSDELKAFLGIIITMGAITLPNIDLYWSSDPYYRQDSVADVMTVKRFKKIREAFHCNDNETAARRGEPNYDKLHKVRPVIDALNKKFQNVYVPSNCHSIDESMILFKGRSIMKQFMPKKPIKRGYKVWVRADPVTGYISQFEVYTGKSPSAASQDPLGSRVVKSLCESIHGSNYDYPVLIIFDNFFTSFELMKDLLQKQLYAVGTVRTNKKTLPPQFKTKQKLKRGEQLAFIKNNVSAGVWQDNRPVHFLTTAHSAINVVTVQRKEKDGSKSLVPCPKALRDYTAYMRGVDRFDQLKESYSVTRRSKKYWFRLFYFLVDAALVNAYILHQMFFAGTQKKMLHIDFQKLVSQHLVANFSSRKKRGASSLYYLNKKFTSGTKAIGVPPEIRFANVGCHFPEEGESYRRCRLCSTAHHDKRSKLVCSTCRVPLCATPFLLQTLSSNVMSLLCIVAC